MNIVDRVRYEDMDFVWIECHYDIHWTGLCNHYIHGLCKFKTVDIDREDVFCPRCDFDEVDAKCICPEPYTNLMCDIYRMTTWESIKARADKWLFEFCVGKHWTIKDRKNGATFCRSFDHPLVWFYYRFGVRRWIKDTIAKWRAK